MALIPFDQEKLAVQGRARNLFISTFHPPPWSDPQTRAIKALKEMCQKPIPLHIPTSGQRILQTDASDEFWGALLLEKINDKIHYCGHANGQFSHLSKSK